MRIAGVLWWLWLARGPQSEGREQLGRMLASAHLLASPTVGHASREVPTERSLQANMANVLYGAGRLAFQQDDYASARSLHEQSLALRQEIGDEQGVGYSLQGLAAVVQAQGERDLARSLYEQALAKRRELNDLPGIGASLLALGSLAYLNGDNASARSSFEQALNIGREVGNKWGIIWTLYWLGVMAHTQEEYVRAHSLLEEALELAEDVGHKGLIAQTLGDLGGVASSQGNYDQARSLYRRSLVLRRENGDRYGIAVCLAGLGELALAAGAGLEHSGPANEEKFQMAAKLLGATEALMKEIGSSLVGNNGRAYRRGVSAAREMLGEEAFAKMWAEGRTMSLENVITMAESMI